MSTAPNYRPDIDGLRAVAILAVIGFHAFPRQIRGGFVGVDVFFVISGFLISTIIIKGLKNHTFSFADFYVRRVRRIFPALMIVMCFCIGSGWFLLVPLEFWQLGKHAAAGAAFVSNFAFWGETGYFAEASAAKPLLHLWSLGIEEQFYIVWPAILFMSWKSRASFPAVILILGVLSFGLNIALTRSDTAAAFFSPASRFWELLTGALVAYASSHQPKGLIRLGPNLANVLSAIGVLTLVVCVILLPTAAAFPGWRVLVPTLSAAIIISVGERAWLNHAILARPVMIWFGLISYPLYLWHWPLLSFAWIQYGSLPPVAVRVGCVLVSIGLAWLTYRFVEKPIQRSRTSNVMKPIFLSAGIFALGCIGLVVYFEGGIPNRMAGVVAYNAVHDDSVLSTPACFKQFHNLFDQGPLQKRDICFWGGSDQQPDILMVGDSHALQLYQGFRSLDVENIGILGRGSCAPILTARQIDWLKCQPTGDNILDFAARSDFKLLILTGVFERYFDGTYGNIPLVDLEEDVRKTFKKLAQNSKNVLVVLDNPSLPFDARACFKRPIAFRAPRDCSFNREFFDKNAARYKSLIRKYASRYKNIALLDPSAEFCDSRKCYATNAQGLLYSGDNNHLNIRGARIVDRAIIRRYPGIFPWN